jgi:hypothetical protein
MSHPLLFLLFTPLFEGIPSLLVSLNVSRFDPAYEDLRSKLSELLFLSFPAGLTNMANRMPKARTRMAMNNIDRL